MSLDFHSRAWNFPGYFWPARIAHTPPRLTLPQLSEPVALKWPSVEIILSNLGHPYQGKCVVFIGKHCNAFAPVSALHYDPRQFCNALMLAQGCGVWRKLLICSDFQFKVVKACTDGIRKLKNMLEDAKLTRPDARQSQAMMHCDTEALVGLKD